MALPWKRLCSACNAVVNDLRRLSASALNPTKLPNMPSPAFTISMCASALSTECRNTSAAKVLDAIRAEKYQAQVEAIRAKYARASADGRDAKETVSGLKKKLPGALWSGTFFARNGAALVAHSGLLCADLDDLHADKLAQVRTQLEADAHVVAMFLSPTGTGLKVVFRVPASAEGHAASFAAVAAHVRQLCGVEIDQACKDVARLCFVSHDPQAYWNGDAQELAPLVQVSAPKLQLPPRTTTNANGLPPSVDRLLATGAQVGRRNAEAFRLACQLRDAGLSESAAESRILEFAARCSPALATREALATLRSAYTAPPREPARNAASASSTAPTNPTDEEAFRKLAALPPAEYDRVREAEAERLNIRVGTLDAEVDARRPKRQEAAQGKPMEFPDPEPWPSSVRGGDLLDSIRDTIRRFVVAGDTILDTAALFVLFTYTFDFGDICPLLVISGPTKRCGKSRLLFTLGKLVRRPLGASSASAAGLYRCIEMHAPTLLIDECDAFFDANEELRGLINSGHTRDAAFHLGCVKVDGDIEPRRWSTWTPKLLCGIGDHWLADTVRDRAFVVRMERKRASEPAERLRHGLRFDDLRRQCARFATDNEAAIRNANPAIPANLNDRAADNWLPLLALADLAGGDWPRRARHAALVLSGGEDEALGLGAQLLADIRQMFSDAGTDKLTSKDLCARLATIEGRPWAEYGRARREISPNQLATLLREFGVASRTIRISDGTARGYELSDFGDAFGRYLSPSSAQNGFPKRHNDTTRASIDENPLFQGDTKGECVTSENATLTNNDGPCVTVSLQKSDLDGEEETGAVPPPPESTPANPILEESLL